MTGTPCQATAAVSGACFNLAECHAEPGRFAEAAEACRTALAREPCDESFHRAPMRYLVRLGRPDRPWPSSARCRRLLAQELGAQPTPETQRLQRQVLEDQRDAGA